MTKEQQKNFLEAVELAVLWGGDVDAVTLGDRTALHGVALYRAALYGLTEVVQCLAGQGANLDAKDMYGQRG